MKTYNTDQTLSTQLFVSADGREDVFKIGRASVHFIALE
jgi:hypothetical protein